MHVPMTFDTVKKAFLAVGLAGLAVSAFMTGSFGYSFSLTHAIGLVCVTIAAALIFPAKRFLIDAGVGKGTRVAFNILGCFFIALELFSDLGYTIGKRDKQMVEAGAQTAAYTAVQDNMVSEKTNLEMWRKQLADLKSQNAWSATVTATGLRAQLDSAQKAIDLEGARGGCKTKCLALMKDKAGIEDRIATLEKTEDLGKRIEATQRILDRKVEKAPDTKIGHSTVKAQVDFVSKGWLLLTTDNTEKALHPDQVTMTVADWVIGFAIALGATFLPTVAFYIAFFGTSSSAPKMQSRSVPLAAAPAHAVSNTVLLTERDPEFGAWRQRVHAALNSQQVAA